jgi:hypothetical protein
MLTTALDRIQGCSAITEAFNPHVELSRRQHLHHLPVAGLPGFADAGLVGLKESSQS